MSLHRHRKLHVKTSTKSTTLEHVNFHSITIHSTATNNGGGHPVGCHSNGHYHSTSEQYIDTTNDWSMSSDDQHRVNSSMADSHRSTNYHKHRHHYHYPNQQSPLLARPTSSRSQRSDSTTTSSSSFLHGNNLMTTSLNSHAAALSELSVMDEWMKEQPMVLLRLDPSDRLVLKIAGTFIAFFFLGIALMFSAYL